MAVIRHDNSTTHNPRCLDGSGTWLQGFVAATYTELLYMLGEPDSHADNDETAWTVRIDKLRERAMVYVLSSPTTVQRTPDALRNWHIGGCVHDVVAAVRASIHHYRDRHPEARFEALGRQAFTAGEPAAPTLNPAVRAAIANLPVGGGAADIFAAFSRGWNAANLESSAGA